MKLSRAVLYIRTLSCKLLVCCLKSGEYFQIAKHVQCWEDFKKVRLSYIETHFGQSYLQEYSSDMSILMNCTYESLFDEAS